MKNDIADILFKYTTGEATLEETNDALKEAEAGFNLEPGRNEITPDEMALTTVGDTPEEVNGFGLLDTGTGSMEKVHVTNGRLDEAINQVNHDGTTNIASLARNATYEKRVRQDMKKKAELAFEQMETELMAAIKQHPELAGELHDVLERAREKVLADGED